MDSNKGLGRGLDALFGNQPVPAVTGTAVGTTRLLRSDQIVASPLQPRQHFDPAALSDLAESIRKHGIL